MSKIISRVFTATRNLNRAEVALNEAEAKVVQRLRNLQQVANNLCAKQSIPSGRLGVAELRLPRELHWLALDTFTIDRVTVGLFPYEDGKDRVRFRTTDGKTMEVTAKMLSMSVWEVCARIRPLAKTAATQQRRYEAKRLEQSIRDLKRQLAYTEQQAESIGVKGR